MCNDPKNIRRGCYGVYFILATCLLIIITLVTIIPNINYHDYDLYKCNITRVDFPTQSPISNGNNTNWKSCKCGRNCRSWSPCIKIYTNIDKPRLIKNQYYRDRNSECTFTENKCPKGNGPFYIQQALLSSMDTYKQYMNTEIDCYHDTPITHIYLSMYNYFDHMYFPAAILIILTILCLIDVYYNMCKPIKDNSSPEDEGGQWFHFSQLDTPDTSDLAGLSETSLPQVIVCNNEVIPPPFSDENPPPFADENPPPFDQTRV